MVRVVKGSPTPEELAAVLAVLGAAASAASAASSSATPLAGEPGPTGWSAYWRSVRAPLAPGPGAWRSSSRP